MLCAILTHYFSYRKYILPYRLRNAMASENDPLIRVPRWNDSLHRLETVPATLPYPTSRQALMSMTGMLPRVKIGMNQY